MVVLIDNYDSFTYVLADYFHRVGVTCRVFRNDAISVRELINLDPKAIVISPGPGTPEQSGMVIEALAQCPSATPILGICLGHQAMGTFLGAKLVRSRVPVHGKTSAVLHTGHALFEGLPNPFPAMRYHSLELKQLPPDLQSICHTPEGVCMGMIHRYKPWVGFQFHPESILTTHGLRLMKNWVSLYLSLPSNAKGDRS